MSPELPKQGSRPRHCAGDGKEVGQDAQDHSRSLVPRASDARFSVCGSGPSIWSVREGGVRRTGSSRRRAVAPDRRRATGAPTPRRTTDPSPVGAPGRLAPLDGTPWTPLRPACRRLNLAARSAPRDGEKRRVHPVRFVLGSVSELWDDRLIGGTPIGLASASPTHEAYVGAEAARPRGPRRQSPPADRPGRAQGRRGVAWLRRTGEPEGEPTQMRQDARGPWLDRGWLGSRGVRGSSTRTK